METCITGTGKTTKWTVQEFILTLMAVNILDIGKTEESKV